MKKIYLITMDKVDWDEYNGFVIIAKNKDRAIQIMKEFGGVTRTDNVTEKNIKNITCIGQSNRKEGSVLESYNAG